MTEHHGLHDGPSQVESATGDIEAVRLITDMRYSAPEDTQQGQSLITMIAIDLLDAMAH